MMPEKLIAYFRIAALSPDTFLGLFFLSCSLLFGTHTTLAKRLSFTIARHFVRHSREFYYNNDTNNYYTFTKT